MQVYCVEQAKKVSCVATHMRKVLGLKSGRGLTIFTAFFILSLRYSIDELYNRLLPFTFKLLLLPATVMLLEGINVRLNNNNYEGIKTQGSPSSNETHKCIQSVVLYTDS
jgi:hypothetical protein